LADGAHNPASAQTLANYISQLISQRSKKLLLTYILALSHSPLKTPFETLSPLLPPQLDTNVAFPIMVNVAAVGFSEPEGMPWVKAVLATDLEETVKQLMPSANIWIGKGDSASDLPRAFQWAAEQLQQFEGHGLVIVAGSLYLVADFYRAMSDSVKY
jgi:folylpolyglutamate synthase